DLSSGRVTLKGPQCNGLYPLHFLNSSTKSASLQQSHFTNSDSTALTATTTNTISADIWHKRPAHSSFQTFQHVCKILSLNNVLKQPLFCHEDLDLASNVTDVETGRFFPFSE
ncbi:hypothetical protein MKW98_006191, partial [Papaver atlanticum]